MGNREKDYWLKKSEKYGDKATARARATLLRQDQHVSHVIVEKQGESYVVNFSVAKFYQEELDRAGVKL